MNTLRFTCSAVAMLAASPVLAQSPAEPDLEELVRQQAAEIAELRVRLDRLEHERDGVAADAETQQMAQIDPAADAEQTSASGVVADWGDGLPTFRSANGTYTFKPRGRILADVSSTFGSRYDARNHTATGMRALRMGVEGGVGRRFFYQFEADFSDNDIDVASAFLGWRDSIGSEMAYDIRVGHVFNDRSFEGSTSSDATPFLERSVVATAIIPQRGSYGMGAMSRLFWDNGHVSLAVTGDRLDGNQNTGDSRIVMTRVHWNPVKSNRALMHIGLWGFDEYLSPGATNLARNTSIGGRFNDALRVSTGALSGGRSTTGFGAELGAFAGPAWAMAEFGERRARLDAGRSDFLSEAWSLAGGWFVTGELPPYGSRTGNFGQPNVLNSVFKGGPGAIELTARYENIDYTSLVKGGEGWAATIGTNWYLNDFTRLQFNWVHWNTDNQSGAFTGPDGGETIATRIGVTF
ncbi:OprO/OprP family phosphate-selective porin [Qipengyuania sp. NPDC077563]|uniref:OprO/OprP family phosphate-selective porin n=1 Tax=Qipengyuania sp. NPDC077563 TaxID=3364497 RepID=UPI00384FDB23